MASWGGEHQQIEETNSLCKNPEARVCLVDSTKTFFLIGEMWMNYFSFYFTLIDYFK